MQTSSDYKYWFQRRIGWFLIVAFTLIPILGWIDAAQSTWSTTNWQLNFSNLGKVLGLAGFMLFAINMILSLRKSWLENLFGGLNRTYIAHHMTGGLALIFLCFHPFLMAINYIDLNFISSIKSAALFLLPRGIHLAGTFDDVRQSTALNSGIIALVLLVGLLYITFYVKLPYNMWLFSHKFLGLAFVFAGYHVLLYNSALHDRVWLFTYIVSWFVFGLGAFIYHTLFGGMWIRREPYQVKAVTMDEANVVSISLVPVRKRIAFKPGQFIFIRFLWDEDRDSIDKEAHPFSIASSPDENDLRIHVKALGDYTSTLKRLTVGTLAEVEGAFGRFIPSHFTMREQIWIAGGIGITPYLSMAHSYKSTDPAVNLFYSVRTRSELLDPDFLSSTLPLACPQFKFIPFVSEERKAFLDVAFIAQESGGLANKEIFLCGPPPMMKALRQQLQKQGVPGRLIHDEAFAIS